MEDQEHFLKDCTGLRQVRNLDYVTEDVGLESVFFLFDGKRKEDAEQRKRYLLDIWKEREKIL